MCIRDSLFELRSTKVSDEDYRPLSVTKKGIVPQLDSVAKSDNHANRKLVKEGDFAINSRSDRRNSCGFSPYDGSVSTITTVLFPRQPIVSRYFDLLFDTPRFAENSTDGGMELIAISGRPIGRT